MPAHRQRQDIFMENLDLAVEKVVNNIAALLAKQHVKSQWKCIVIVNEVGLGCREDGQQYWYNVNRAMC